MSAYAFRIVETLGELEALRAESTPVLLSAYGDGCGICLCPAAEDAIAAAHGANLVLIKMSVDDVPELDEQLGIDTIPTLLLFRKNRARRKFHSNPDVNGANVVQWLDDALEQPKDLPSTAG
ncbi:thioredoxin family protein [Aquincola sp. S2]|uniref:Thioredoxin family protein n=1 Tax=Pseudaquabacterium terrae TaxID=2732868 RepID=A0ABX2EPP2_9BURK|nr:thioredoxin family protein [Aquabacterium terrae]NRF70611.1 thioredoxin family protein [Aquabacterium terrae]